jgi:8-oxo-dGTP pyrophosphatase MutT (NUDIX family)
MQEDKMSSAKEFLLADYKYLCDSFWKNEETGETRVRFFITLVTAVLAAVGALLANAIQKNEFDLVIPICLFSLFALFLLGLVTLLRLLKRNKVTDGYKKDMDEIRQRFKEYFDEYGILSGYDPFGGVEARDIQVRKIGGLAHTVSVINSLVIAAVAGIASSGSSPVISSIIVIVTFVACCALHFYYISRADERHKGDLSLLRITHAGGIVYKMSDKRPLFLVVSAKGNPSHWVLPKGHIENGESPSDAAIREVMEETGVVASIAGTIGIINFKTDKESVKAKFYLMKYIREGEIVIDEHREQKWSTVEEAIDLLSFEDTRQLIRFAECRIAEQEK